ncbi:tagaturonate reductase [Alicyclobacillus hesperidum]|uniref:Tagaturonate reductase n=1 Tax=Alicyclobacillus hesperidum TaxID=89784 RepID=A0A1H2SPJ7_9BACL|nr:tagaturonate reductase [Alicyclobacillus hesperidum]SDW33556.1 tagaturonate reductase [Alicyclobacillus hesperidum]
MRPLTQEMLSSQPDLAPAWNVSQFAPERILQIGEGVFLRGFADWLIDRLNAAGSSVGRIVIAAPRPTGARNIERFRKQDGLYTVLLRGMENGRTVDRQEVVSSISRAIDPHLQWNDFLACARQREIDVVISNTTELGIQYAPQQYRAGQVPTTYPAKLAAYLYERYQAFGGDPKAGMTILPCELIDDNGTLLRDIVMRHSQEWGLPAAFVEWVRLHNVFCNTLVDRIVTPFTPEADGAPELPYTDELAVVAEPFHMWAIEGGDHLRSRWPFAELGLSVYFVPCIEDYRLQKVRVLNGAHTAMACLGLLAEKQTVLDVMSDPVLHAFVERLIGSEIVPTVTPQVGDAEVLRRFAKDVIDRFNNPFLRHALTSIANNSLAKARIRLVPTIVEYADRHRVSPPLAAAAIALLCYACHPSCAQEAMDDPLRSRLQEIWVSETEADLAGTVTELLKASDVWGCDLAVLPGMADMVQDVMRLVQERGVVQAIAFWLQSKPVSEPMRR